MTAQPERRRSPRFSLNIAVIVGFEERFEEWRYVEAFTLEVSAHGALVEMGTKPVAGQPMLVLNRASGKKQMCRVVSVARQPSSHYAVAFEFVDPTAGFWPIPSLVTEQLP